MNDQPCLSRRQFLATAAAATGSLALRRWSFAEPPADNFSFFVIGDTHYLADKDNPAKLTARSAAMTAGLIETLNRLPGTEIPAAAGAGRVVSPRGVIHAGDLIDSGDKTGGPHPQMQQTEWDAFVADFGLTGRDGRLKFPVYEVHGNHDSPHGDGVAIDGIVARNQKRPGLAHVSANGLHYSWDWGPIHFINLGIVVGAVKTPARQRRYNSRDSLAFLVDDLAKKVGTSGRPVIITHHVDIARNTGPCDAAAPFANQEWDVCDVRGFYEALQPYRIAAILYGHTHARNILHWDAQGTKADTGYAIFNVTQASHFNSDTHAFFHFEMTGPRIIVREYRTTDGWATAQWTPQTWTVPLEVPARIKPS